MWAISEKHKVRIHSSRDRFFHFSMLGEHQGRLNEEYGFEG